MNTARLLTAAGGLVVLLPATAFFSTDRVVQPAAASGQPAAASGQPAAASGQPAAASAALANRYIGARACKNCHQGEAKGVAFEAWEKSGHARAFESLASAEAKEFAAEKGIADPQKADACLQCHVTAFGASKREIKRGFDQALGVQCETCHGPGEEHAKTRFRVASESGAEIGEAHVTIPDDEIIKAPTVESCLACHNDKSPTFKPFCFKERNKEIEHLDPRIERTDEWRAARACHCEPPCPCEQAECSKAPAKTDAVKEPGAGKDASPVKGGK